FNASTTFGKTQARKAPLEVGGVHSLVTPTRRRPSTHNRILETSAMPAHTVFPEADRGTGTASLRETDASLDLKATAQLQVGHESTEFAFKAVVHRFAPAGRPSRILTLPPERLNSETTTFSRVQC